MSRKTTIIFIRHGETEWNLQGRFQGQLDSPLTSLGQSQARAVAKRMGQVPFDHLYSSDLDRTYQTAQAIADVTRHTIMKEPLLREKGGGILQGMTANEITIQYPELRAEISKGRPDYAVPDGESLNQVVARGIAVLDRLQKNHRNQTVVAITHGGFLSALMRHILQIPLEAPRRFHIYNTSLNMLSYDDKVWEIESMGDASHLEQLNMRDDIER